MLTLNSSSYDDGGLSCCWFKALLLAISRTEGDEEGDIEISLVAVTPGVLMSLELKCAGSSSFNFSSSS